MVNELLQSVAYTAYFKAFLTGTNTAATGKTIPVQILKSGGAFGNPAAGATNATEDANGWYHVALGTGDTGTLGDLIVRGTEGSIDPVERMFCIVVATNRGMTNLDAAITSRMATYTQPTGFLAATFPTTVASTTNITAGTITTVTTTTNLTNLPTMPANWITTLGITDGAFTAAKFAAGSLDGKGNWWLIADMPANMPLFAIGADGVGESNMVQVQGEAAEAITDGELTTAAVNALLTALTQSYHAVGATGSAAQLLYEIAGHLGRSGIVGTLKTVYQLDGTTPAKTFTLNSASSPSAVTETS